ncbi:hypothetical protein [Hymenobacter fastidiosus]|uniref:hypothetical protein n=1 Tax=Hymenobacter fastidiosus TaxID=486264 RepID=UPI0031E550AC
MTLVTAARQPTPKLPPLVLRATPLPPAATRFYAAAVLDARTSRGAVAHLLTSPTKPGQPGVVQPVGLAGGTRAALQGFVQQSVPPNPARRGVTIRLTECQVTEKAVPGSPGQVEGRVVVAMAFEWQRDGQTVPLTEYRNVARYGRPVGQRAVVAPTLQTALGLGLRYLNDWLIQAEGHNLKLVEGVRVTFQDFTQNTDPDTLFYAPGRPLTRADFRGPPRPGHYAAAVFPSFAFSLQPRIAQGRLQLDVQTKVFVVRNSSWMSAAADAAVLNHEQRHFDLAKLVAERFKQKIQADRLRVDDYNAVIQLAYFTSFQEMNRLQEQYDHEISTGPVGAQQRWDERIATELRAREQQP